ncbi:MAG: hypothetical protein GEV08_16575 [Acidimicrobiia bacterium]|nr:hypothetical protein [Acidimicrobiia bacterium]
MSRANASTSAGVDSVASTICMVTQRNDGGGQGRRSQFDALGPRGRGSVASMDYLRWSSEPNLRRPIILAAFEGWNDAGDAATTAVRFLSDRWEARPFADIDAEPFYDFTTARPQVELGDGHTRRIVWPRNQLSAAAVPGLEGDVIVLEGSEPALMWRTFCEQVIAIARRYDAQLVVTIGALVSDVPHTRPVQIFGSGYDASSVERFDVEPSTYEGPTGIVGVLHAACRDADIPSASLWAAVPSYVHGAPSPRRRSPSCPRSPSCSPSTCPPPTSRSPPRHTSARSTGWSRTTRTPSAWSANSSSATTRWARAGPSSKRSSSSCAASPTTDPTGAAVAPGQEAGQSRPARALTTV